MSASVSCLIGQHEFARRQERFSVPVLLGSAGGPWLLDDERYATSPLGFVACRPRCPPRLAVSHLLPGSAYRAAGFAFDADRHLRRSQALSHAANGAVSPRRV
jgi:hypothetical protein